ncbi:TolC family protein [Arcobacter roscoffensis]|uniref:TolC family protein n=1 Tax=Arcobacter roscoffensis TaxID=2961520 RepID=A0ABY5E903_9BACT|nr:TolC family protein [Arcobacter roscoffensis]UTJ07256.1 TolC family protein [Arcobacter roscoffensis]
MKNIKNKLLKLSLVASIFVSGASSLDLKQAVDLALKNNHELKAQAYDYKQSVQNIELSNANYLPKLDLAYGYNKRDEIVGNQSKEDASFSAALSYNLFNGLKDISNKQASQYLSKSSDYSLTALKHDIVLETKKAYINYLDKLNVLKTYESEYKLFDNQFKDAKNRYEQGLLARNDFLQVQVNMSGAKQNVVKAKSDVKIAKLQLSNILGGYDLSNESIENFEAKSIVSSTYKQELLEKRSEVEALKMSLEALKKQRKAQKGSYLPKLDAKIAHNRFYEDLGFNEIDGNDNQNVATLSASWNLYDGGSTQTQVAIYNTQISKLKTQIQKTQLDINLQYENAKSTLEVASDNYETASLALKQAKENYEIVNNRFKEGVSTSTDLTDANFLLTSAKQKYNRAYFDKYLSIATLDRIFEIK